MIQNARVKKAVATAICAALFFTAPGLPVYQVLAAQVTAVNVAAPQGSSIPGAVSGAHIQSIGSISAPIGGRVSAPGALRSSLPDAASIGVAISPAQAAPASLQAALEPALLSGRVGKAILERAAKAEDAPQGLFQILLHRVRGSQAGQAAATPAEHAAIGAAEKWLAPSAKTLGSASSSKAWGLRSFSELRGESVHAAASRGALPVFAGSARQAGALKPAPDAGGMRKAGDHVARGYAKFPVRARNMTPESMLAGKAKARKHARKIARDARLVRVSINLDSSKARWVYLFHSREKGKVITVYSNGETKVRGDRRSQKGAAGSKNLTPLRTSQTLWNARLAKLGGLQEAYNQLKAETHWFRPVRVSIVSKWHSDPVFAFIDAGGRVREIAAVKPRSPAAAAPAKGAADAKAPGEVAPPAERPAPPEARAPPGGEGRQASKPAKSRPHLVEDFFGFRRVRGYKHDSSLKRLPHDADTARIIDQIARQFNIDRARVLDLGERYALSAASDRKSWLAVYERLQRENRAERDHLDQKKYQGSLLGEALSRLFVRLGWRKKVSEAGFRKLENRRYPEGMKGLLIRALEVHKHAFGMFRFVYHVFDAFFFGYFRRSSSFELLHSTEDYLTLRADLVRDKALADGRMSSLLEEELPTAEKSLEAALSVQFHRGLSFSDRVNASAIGRWTRYPVRLVLAPLTQFVWRRATLALFSAVAMGLVAGLVPLPFLSIHLTALPVLGPALEGLAHGAPMLASQVPFIGGSLANITGSALNALVEGLSVGSLVQTFTLSSMLTFPAAVKQRLMERRGFNLRTPHALSRAFFTGVLGTAVSWTFWAQNLKSFFGLIVIGAEIEGVMTYAAETDAFISPAYQALTGHQFKLFESIGAAIERPQGRSPIPFGGAITWGNALIYKLQNLIGFNLTDEVYRIVHGAAYGSYDGAVSEAMVQARHAAPGASRANAGASVVAGVVGAAGHT
ncbi:MAG: hypothetical protein ABII00_05225, partial [Elusimicrobiota bacterium]